MTRYYKRIPFTKKLLRDAMEAEDKNIYYFTREGSPFDNTDCLIFFPSVRELIIRLYGNDPFVIAKSPEVKDQYIILDQKIRNENSANTLRL